MPPGPVQPAAHFRGGCWRGGRSAQEVEHLLPGLLDSVDRKYHPIDLKHAEIVRLAPSTGIESSLLEDDCPGLGVYRVDQGFEFAQITVGLKEQLSNRPSQDLQLIVAD